MSEITPAHVREVADAVARAELWAVKEAARILRNCAKAMEECEEISHNIAPSQQTRVRLADEILSILRSTEG